MVARLGLLVISSLTRFRKASMTLLDRIVEGGKHKLNELLNLLNYITDITAETKDNVKIFVSICLF